MPSKASVRIPAPGMLLATLVSPSSSKASFTLQQAEAQEVNRMQPCCAPLCCTEGWVPPRDQTPPAASRGRLPRSRQHACGRPSTHRVLGRL